MFDSSAVGVIGAAVVNLSGTGTLTFSSNSNVSVGSASNVVLSRNVSVNGSLSVSGTLNCGTNTVTGTGAFTLGSGAALLIGSVDGITSTNAAGNIQVSGSRSYNSGGNYSYVGSSAQATGDGLPAQINDLTINNGSGVALSQDVAVNGTLSLSNGALDIGARTLTLNGAVTVASGSLTGGGTSNITVGGSGAGTTLPAVSLNTLTVSRANGISLGGSASVSGSLVLSSGAVSNANNLTLTDGAALVRSAGSLSGTPTFNVNHDVSYLNTLTTGSELPTSSTALRNLTIDPGSSATVTLGRDVTVNGTLTLISGTLDIGANTLELMGSVSGTGAFSSSITGEVVYGQTSDGQSVFSANYGNLTFNNFKKTLSSTGPINVAATFSPGNGVGHTIAGSTMNFNGAAQTIPSFTYNNLTLSGSGTKTAGSDFVVQGTLTISNVEFADAGSTIVVKGSIVNTGQQSGVGRLKLFGGSAPHVLSGSGTFQNLELDDVQGGSLSSTDITINGTLTLTTGKITTGAKQVVMGQAGTITGASIANYIYGNLQKQFGVGLQSFTYLIGDAGTSIPVEISSMNVTTPGYMTVSTVGERHPDIVTSGVDQTKTMNRYWTVSRGGGIVFSAYDINLSFVPGDLDPPGNPSNFIIRIFDGEDWSSTGLGSKTGTTTQATGVSSVGDFVIGELALVGTPVALDLISGNNQTGIAGSALGNPFTVFVKDAAGNPVQNTRVRFTIVKTPSGAAGQSLGATSVFTDANGKASTFITLGSKTGIYQVTAASTGLSGSPITFTATALSGGAAKIALATGNNQSGIVTSILPNLLVVKLTDTFGNSVEGAPVEFEFSSVPVGAAGHSLSVQSATSADDGLAATSLTLGSKAGNYTVTASSANIEGEQILFTATATIGPAKNLLLTSGDSQSGKVSTALSAPFVVSITDAGGNAIQGASVTFAIASAPSGATGQALTVTSAVTNSSGQASTILTLGNKVGSYTVTAASAGLSGSPITFVATATGGTPATLILASGNNQVATVMSALPEPLVVTVTDGEGNPAPGVGVTFAIASTPAGATGQKLSVTNASTNADGQASTALTLGDREGVYAVAASSEGLAGSPVLFLAVALSVTGVERVEVLPAEFQLHQNYPNPFNPSTEIQFDLKEEGQVHLTVHDMAGRVTDLLVDGVQMMTGRYRLRWDAADRASGVYLLRLIVSRRNAHAPFVATRKLVLLR